MKTLQFEAVKVAFKQDKNGYILTLCIHPDEVPEDLLRSFVGAVYQVVMVRLDRNADPQEEFESDKAVKMAGMLCRDPKFWEFLHEDSQIFTATEKDATDWLRDFLEIQSRTELKDNAEARTRLDSLHKEFLAWKQRN
ncbi:MAG: hypothetical protein EBR82_59210 [Caulobacteraceae bacterium]|jgi:hypothetical protein|nr:hypothetical protein [Caulobacteraceae bacterium]